MRRAQSGGQGQGKGRCSREKRGERGRRTEVTTALPSSSPSHCKKSFWAIFLMRTDLLATCFILFRAQISRNLQLGCQGFRTVSGKQICACGQSEGRRRCRLGGPCAYINQPSPLVNLGTGQVLSNAAARIRAPND